MIGYFLQIFSSECDTPVACNEVTTELIYEENARLFTPDFSSIFQNPHLIWNKTRFYGALIEALVPEILSFIRRMQSSY